jgi:serine phosphatase RsbU (regulator of sigma subunit)
VFDEVSTTLQPGDSLAIYTDGLLEARAPSRMVTGGQLIEQLTLRSPSGAQEAVDALLELIDFEQDVRDDVAVVVARVTGANAAAPR